MGDLRYTNTAIALHWIVAAMVLTLLPLGWYMADLPTGDQRSTLIRLHKTIGITVFLLMLLRVFWRARHGAPPLAGVPRWQARLARANHAVMYVFLFIQPVTGYLSSSFSGYGTRYLGVDLPQWGWEDEALNTLFNTIHQASGKVLAVLIALHFLGAMTHLLVYRDSVVRSMMPGRSETRRTESGLDRLSA